MSYVEAWLRAFATTTLVETLVVAVALRTRVPWIRALAAAFFAQAITHPAVWFIIPALSLPRYAFLAVAESWAVLAEACFYGFAFARLRAAQALGLSLVANGASWGVGTLLRHLGVPL